MTSPDQTSLNPTFSLSSILSWIGVASLVLAQFGAQLGNAGFSDWPSLIFVLVFLLPAALCIPYLVERLLETYSANSESLSFSTFAKCCLVFGVGIYSMLMFMCSSNLFNAEWKGAKGGSLWFYMLEGNPSFTWWPSYLFGATVFIYAVCQERDAVGYLWIFVCIVIQTIISFCYTFACVFMNFANGPFTIIPGSCAICYLLFGVIIFRRREWTLASAWHQWLIVLASVFAFIAGTVAKYPLAKTLYDQLPEEPPDNCFVVTAATRGHVNVVRTWYDDELGRTVNHQLLNLWQFESMLRTRVPRIHALIRLVYNWLGPKLARLVLFRWQANLVYIILKPVEAVAVVAVALCSNRNREKP